MSGSHDDEFYNEIFEFWNRRVAYSFVVGVKPMTPMENLPDKYPETQISEKGEIAVKYRQPGNVLITGTPSGREYVAVTQANICMAWIDLADLDFVLAKRDGCCGKKQQSFSLANESDVRRWTNRGGQ